MPHRSLPSPTFFALLALLALLATGGFRAGGPEGAGDIDGDGVGDGVDNCPLTPNPGQADEDADGRGDACDFCPFGPDLDNDGLCDGVDVCPVDPVETGVVRLSAPLVAGGNVAAFRSSADGEWVAYMADQETVGVVELYGVRSIGGVVTRLSAALVSGGNVLDFAISEDNTTVVYLADGDVDERADLYSVPITGGTATRLTATNAAGTDEFAITPDGTRTVYRIGHDLFSVHTAGGAPIPLTIPGYDWVQPGFKISPDSAYVVFIENMPGDQGVNSFTVDGSSRAGIACCMANVFGIWISPDSDRVVWQSETSTIFYTQSEPIKGGTSQTHCLQTPGTHVETLGITPSPLDALRILYVCDYPQRLVSEPIEGGAQIDLDDAGIIEAITPDGSRVVHRWVTSAARSPSEGDLRSVEITGGTPVTLNPALVANGEIVGVRATADSLALVYRADQEVDERFDLYGVPVVGGVVVKLNGDLGNQQDVTTFEVSPLSDTVVYVADQETNSTFELFAVPADGGNARKMNEPLPNQGDITSFAIGVNGKQLFYLGDQFTNGVEELFAIRLDTDTDADGVPGDCDCDSAAASVWSLPGEVRELILTQADGTTTLTWTEPTVPGSVSVLYDTLRTDQPNGFALGSGATVVEIESDGADTASADADDPPQAFYYVVRGGNGCGEGTIGCSRDAVGPCP